jgi:hypothetical protein
MALSIMDSGWQASSKVKESMLMRKGSASSMFGIRVNVREDLIAS